MEVTQIITDGFDLKDDHEFMHSVRQYYENIGTYGR